MILNEWQCCGPSLSAHETARGGCALTGIVISAAVESEQAQLTGVVVERHSGTPYAMLTGVVQAQTPWLLNITNAAGRGALGNEITNDVTVHS